MPFSSCVLLQGAAQLGLELARRTDPPARRAALARLGRILALDLERRLFADRVLQIAIGDAIAEIWVRSVMSASRIRPSSTWS